MCVCVCGECVTVLSMQAVMRSWKQYYTVLAGPLLNFYREKKDFQQVRLLRGTSIYSFITHQVPMKTANTPHLKTGGSIVQECGS